MAEVPKLFYIVVVDEGEKRVGKGNESFRYTRSVLQSTLQLMGCKARHAFKEARGAQPEKKEDQNSRSSVRRNSGRVAECKNSNEEDEVPGLRFFTEHSLFCSGQITHRVFEVIRSERSGDAMLPFGMDIPGFNGSKGYSEKGNGSYTGGSLGKGEVGNHLAMERDYRSNIKPFELYKRRTTVVVRREIFLDFVCDALAKYKYIGPNQRADLILACRIRERKESVTVLLCGTSGCGKSTLSALLGSRLGVTTVISTDSIRHMMRSFVDENQSPLLWASTYHAGEFLDPVAVAEARAKRKAKKLAHISHSLVKDELSDGISSGRPDARPSDMGSSSTELISPKQMAVEGFKAQSEMVIESLDRLITAWEERKESVVVEGVHLSLNFVMGLMKKHPSIIPFMIHITNEVKHLERFAVRAKYMTLDPSKNKYVKYIRNIRTIQDYLCHRADKHLVPKINNTNVDRSVAAIHATVFSCLRRREAGEQLYDPTTNTVTLIDEEYRNQCAANSLSSKGMFQLIQRKGSSRHLMALLNTDGSVAKAWPVDSIDGNGKPISCCWNEEGIGIPMYGSLQIDKAEPVNLQFGHFGISAWPTTGGTSHAGSVDESRADGAESGSRYYSSCCSSPRMSDGPAKEFQLKEEQSLSGSDEEDDDPPKAESDDDDSDIGETKIHDEMEGSIDEEWTKSDEEYDDLAMQDEQDSGYWSDKDEELKEKLVPLRGEPGSNNGVNLGGDKYQNNLDLFGSS
ncbi:hypothetical protein HHK36_019197 [Tetracentron sinense]|uniref:2-phosphoglycerate kinase n=1 Tax=Tetracentron sinense TaxID=13715 RepID=A0A834YVU2_TETSI|nr:hypothetical protein HHK36_019197 [Tetracentron sinense]